MTKYLVRGKGNPLVRSGIDHCIATNSIGSNSGNLIYANGVFSTLEHPDTIIDFDNYDVESGRMTIADIKRIDSEYDAYIIPLANAFRDAFIDKLNNLTDTIKRLSIPTIILGVGAQFAFEPDFDAPRSYDSAVREFIIAALEKSWCIGVRGEITLEYLKRLGFKEDHDVTVIGCPSMFTFGDALECRMPLIDEHSRISVNFGMSNSLQVRDWLLKLALSYDNGQVVAQRIEDLKRLYLGADLFGGSRMAMHPDEVRCYEEDKVRVFVHAHDWIKAMRSVDLSIGGRIHGSIAAVLGGASTIVIAYDSRTREIAEYHQIPYIQDSRFDPTIPLAEIIDRTEIDTHVRFQKERYSRYADFLTKNELPAPDTALLRSRIGLTQLDTDSTPVPSIMHATKEEAIRRWTAYNEGSAEYRENHIQARINVHKEKQRRLTYLEQFASEQAAIISGMTVRNESLSSEIQRIREEARSTPDKKRAGLRAKGIKLALKGMGAHGSKRD